MKIVVPVYLHAMVFARQSGFVQHPQNCDQLGTAIQICGLCFICYNRLSNNAAGVQTMAKTGTVSTWRKVVAAILDFFTIFFIGGYAIAKLTGNTTNDGFQLNGVPALILFAVIIAYFWLGPKIGGGTLWQRILGTRQ
ncbi:MAG: hypothetical protein R3D34_05890 [Nitratireductor sp.]